MILLCEDESDLQDKIIQSFVISDIWAGGIFKPILISCNI